MSRTGMRFRPVLEASLVILRAEQQPSSVSAISVLLFFPSPDMDPDAPETPPFVTRDDLRAMLQTEVAAVVKETLATLCTNPSAAEDGSSGAPIAPGISHTPSGEPQYYVRMATLMPFVNWRAPGHTNCIISALLVH